MTALSLNEDNNSFFTRAGRTLTRGSVASFVGQYAGTQVSELIHSANSQRTSFPSKVPDSIWKGYGPDGPGGQPLFRKDLHNVGAPERHMHSSSCMNIPISGAAPAVPAAKT